MWFFFFFFIVDKEIHVLEYNYSLTKSKKVINVFNKTVDLHIVEGFNFIYLESMQVFVKTKLYNMPIIIFLIDIRIRKFYNSFIAMMQNNLPGE